MPKTKKQSETRRAWPDNQRLQDLHMIFKSWRRVFFGRTPGRYDTELEWEGKIMGRSGWPSSLVGMRIEGKFKIVSDADIEFDLQQKLGVNLDEYDDQQLFELKLRNVRRGSLRLLSDVSVDPWWDAEIFIQKEEENALLDMLSRLTKAHLGKGGLSMQMTLVHPQSDEPGFWEEHWQDTELEIAEIRIFQDHHPEL